MPISYSFDRRRGLVSTVVSGDNGLDDVIRHLAQVSNEPWFPAPALVDVRSATTSMPSSEIRAVVERLRHLGPRLRGAPIAVLVGTDVGYGLIRMIELLLDDVVIVRPFRDEDEATAWLPSQRGTEESRQT